MPANVTLLTPSNIVDRHSDPTVIRVIRWNRKYLFVVIYFCHCKMFYFICYSVSAFGPVWQPVRCQLSKTTADTLVVMLHVCCSWMVRLLKTCLLWRHVNRLTSLKTNFSYLSHIAALHWSLTMILHHLSNINSLVTIYDSFALFILFFYSLDVFVVYVENLLLITIVNCVLWWW